MGVATGLAVAVALAVMYFLYDPAEESWMPQCLLHRMTGYECAGCGSQRMLHALLHLDIAGALRANALLTLALPYLAFWGWVELTPRRRRGSRKYSLRLERIHRRLNSPRAIGVICIVIVMWSIGRNML